jgi:plasmid stabilization system protein ParE
MTLRVLDLAEADLLAGFRFYQRRSRGVGWYFLDSLAAEIESLHLYAGIHRKYLGYFRMLSHRFPYAVYYQITGNEIQIWRILDCRRNPKWIRKQLRGA